VECNHIMSICPVLVYFCGFHIYDLLYYTCYCFKNVLVFIVNYNFCKSLELVFSPFSMKIMG